MSFIRRRTILMGAAAAVLLPRSVWSATTEEAIAAFTGGAEVSEGDAITLTTPEIAENGNTVPVEVAAPGAQAIGIFAPGNPNAEVGTFVFGPLAAAQTVSTRIRLAETQEVVAIARMSDGSYQRTSREVKVTIGGCGG